MGSKIQKQIIDPLYRYSDLSYAIIGVLYDVYNKLGHGHLAKVYQRAVAVALKKIGLSFVEQLYAPVYYEGVVVDKNFFDFIVEDKMVVELKRGDYFAKAHIEQVYEYLVSKKLQLGQLVYFAPRAKDSSY